MIFNSAAYEARSPLPKLSTSLHELTVRTAYK